MEKYGNGAAQHYQYENAISTYLWLRYPDKYYIYKFGEVKTVANELESDYRFKKGAYADNIRNFLKLYDEISVALKEDTELVNLFQSQLSDQAHLGCAMTGQIEHRQIQRKPQETPCFLRFSLFLYTLLATGLVSKITSL